MLLSSLQPFPLTGFVLSEPYHLKCEMKTFKMTDPEKLNTAYPEVDGHCLERVHAITTICM